MKAKDFIRKFGWDKAKDALNHVAWCEGSFCTKLGHGCIKNDHDCCVDVEEIKKFTDAYDLVQSYGGLYNAKNLVDDMHHDATYDSESIELNQAITLVEEIGECNENN